MNNLFVYLFVALTLGILFRIFFFNVEIPIELIAIFAVVFLVLRGFYSFLALICFVFLLGIYITPKPLKSIENGKEPAFIECKVVSFPEKFFSKNKFNCKVLHSSIKNLKGLQVVVISNLKPDFLSNIYFLGNLKIKNRKIYVNVDKPLIKEEKSKFISLINEIRNTLINKFKEKTLNKESLSIGKALIFGDRSYIDKETLDAYRNTGLIHLLAISGFHIGIIFSVLYLIFSPISKKLAYVSTILFLVIFVFISGFKIPVVRASVGGIIFAVSKLKGYKMDTTNILFFIAFLSVLVEPFTLFSVSFQLSFLAVLGIILVWQKLRFNLKNKFFDIVAKSYITSVVASLFILPVLLFYFGKFSLISILFTTPLITLLYPYVFLEVLNIITTFNFSFLVNFMDFIGIIFLKTVKLLSNFDISISNHFIDIKVVVFYYLVLFSIYIVPIKGRYTFLASLFLFLFIISI